MFCVFNLIIKKNMFFYKGLGWLCTQFISNQGLSLPLYNFFLYFEQSISLALYKILFHAKALYKMESLKYLDINTCFVHSMT